MGGGEWMKGKQVKGIKHSYPDEHGIYGIVESIYCTCESNKTLYIKYTGIKI